MSSNLTQNASAQDDIDSLFKKGSALFDSGKYEEAITYFDKVLDIDSRYVDALYNKGVALDSLGRYEEAITNYDKVLDIDPSAVDALNNKGFALNQIGKYEEAISYLDKALDVNPNDADALLNKGTSLSELGKYEEAITYFDKVLDTDQNHINALNNKGFAFYNLGRSSDAIVFFDKALEKEPDNVRVLINKGAALLDLKKLNDVIDVNDKVLEMDPNNVPALVNKGSAIDELGRHQEAIVVYDKVLNIEPENINALTNKGVSLHELGEYEEAIELYDRVLNLSPDDVDASRNKELSVSALSMNEGSEQSSPASNEINEQRVNLTISEAPANTSFRQYENSTYGISIRYPSNWTAESGNSSPGEEIFSIVGLSPPISTDPNANTFLDIGYDSSVQVNDFNLDEYARGVIESLQTDDTISDFKVQSAKTDATLANKPAYSLVTTNTADGTAMKSLEVGTLVGDKLYYMLFSTEESKYNSFLPDIQKMINSFELVSEKGDSLNENDKKTVANTTESQSENDKTTDANTTESENPSEANSNTSFQSYENSKYGIRVQYPSDWTPQEESNSDDDTFQLMITAPITSNGLSYVVIGHDPSIEAENISLEKYIDDIVKGIKEEGTFNVESVKTDAMLAGRQAYSIVLTNTVDETDRKSLEVGTLVGNKLYRILFDAEKPDYNILLPDVQKMIDSYQISAVESEVTKTNYITTSSIPSVSSNETGGTISMKLELLPNPGADRYDVSSEEISSGNAKICPTNNCQFGLLARIGPDSETIQPGLEPNSDGTEYTFEGTLHVTINDPQGVSTGSASYDLHMDLNKVGSDNKDDETTKNLRGTMTSTDEFNSQAQTEYEVEGTLQTEPNIEHEELQGFIEVVPITLNLTAQEK